MLVAVSQDFAALFSEHLARSRLTESEFARRAGTSQPTVNLAKKGKRTPAPADLPKWATALALHGDEREHFIEAGKSARAAQVKVVSEYVQGLEDRVELLEAIARELVLVAVNNGAKVPKHILKALDSSAE